MNEHCSSLTEIGTHVKLVRLIKMYLSETMISRLKYI